MKLYLVRHGETVKVKGIIQGLDNPLTEKGIMQAKETAQQVEKLTVEHFYCSDVLRARQTAEIINEKINKTIIFDKRLRGGEGDDNVQGLTKEQVNTFVAQGKFKDPQLTQFENAKSFLAELKDKNIDNVLIVGHNGTVKMLTIALQEKEFNKEKVQAMYAVETENASITVIDTEKDNKENMQILRDLISTHKTIRYSVLLPNAHQTVESHVNRMLALAPVIAEIVGMKLDTNHVNSLILAHDLPELGMEKDITALEQVYTKGAKQQKDDLEKQSIIRLGNEYGSWLLELLNEYENQKTEMARFVKWLDKYEASRHMLEISAFSRLQHKTNKDYISFYVNTDRLITATQRLPQMHEFTVSHLEQELAQIFSKNNASEKYEELNKKLRGVN